MSSLDQFTDDRGPSAESESGLLLSASLPTGLSARPPLRCASTRFSASWRRSAFVPRYVSV